MQEVLGYFCLKLSGLLIVTMHSQEADSDLITTKDDFADKRIGNLIIYRLSELWTGTSHASWDKSHTHSWVPPL